MTLATFQLGSYPLKLLSFKGNGRKWFNYIDERCSLLQVIREKQLNDVSEHGKWGVNGNGEILMLFISLTCIATDFAI